MEPPASATTTPRNTYNFSSPLPPCPEDPPAPPPPACTPPKYRPLEENENTEDEQDAAEAAAEPPSFPTPPPPPSPPVASPLGTPPPPPPPYSPPSAKVDVDLSGALDSAAKSAEVEGADAPPPPPEQREESEGEDGDDERDESAAAELLGLPDASSSSVIASMRSAVREREVMAVDTVREPPAKKPRFYVGDIDNYSIIDKVGSGTYGYVHWVGGELLGGA
ncbi:unnamed protein product [Phytophthora fragariaefolia]|uniref:Unnamed protein product n=1 Tax=Phytophthora fragariaefolia TaxID=1490495 RepID=A0A9W6XQG3_9STRA|nr:unnamed protein product [Phytophthora fragariaefolia]